MPFKAYDNAMRAKLSETYTDENRNLAPKYQKTTKGELKKEHRLFKALIEKGREAGFISDEDAALAMPPEPTPSRLYGNPKVHKPIIEGTGIPPLREVVATAGSNVEGPGKIVDDHCHPVDESCRSFLMDTQHLLMKVGAENKKGPQPEGTFIFTLDIVALYVNVPTSRGPQVQKKRLLKARMAPPLVEWLRHGV